jgi:Ca2+-binding RTX toxin-like protein
MRAQLRKLVLPGKVWQKIIVVTTLALPLLLTFVVPAQAVIKIDDIDEDEIFRATTDLRVLIGNDEENLMIGSVLGDFIDGKGDEDLIYSGEGEDQVSGGSGGDLVSAGLDDDFVKGKSGDDVLMGGLDNDIIEGDDGNDNIFGDSGDDTMEGDEGADAFNCGIGVDTITDFNPRQGDTKSPDCEIFDQSIPQDIVR